MVERFNQDGEADSGVEVAFRDVEMEGFGDKAETDHQQETQAEHDDGRMPVHELGQRFAGGNHDGHGNGNGTHGDDDMIDHGDGSDDGIDGKYRVKNQDLGNHAPKSRVFFLTVGNGKLVMPFEAFVQLGGGFVEQEDTAREHNHVFAGNVQPTNVEQRARQGHDMCHEAEHDDADNDRKPQTGNARAVALGGFDFVRQNGDENEVVYPQDDFEYQKRGKAYPSMRLCQPTEIHDFCIPLCSNAKRQPETLKLPDSYRYARKTAGGHAALLWVFHVCVCLK